jgi:TonB family protein
MAHTPIPIRPQNEHAPEATVGSSKKWSSSLSSLLHRYAPSLVISAIADEIDAGAEGLDSLLQRIADQTRLLTGATACAIARLRPSDGAAICCGSSGESAPPLGARLQRDSGISGECLRTGRVLRCDDTEVDKRVDAEVCRRLGIRSLAVAPVKEHPETVGILEVFSDRPRAFTDGHLDTLQDMAELVVAAFERFDETRPQVVPKTRKISAPGAAMESEAVVSGAALPTPIEQFPPVPYVPPYPQESPWQRLLREMVRRRLVLGASASALFLVLLIWHWWPSSPSKPAPTPLATQAQAAAADTTPSGTTEELDLNLNLGAPAAKKRPEKAEARHVVQDAAAKEKTGVQDENEVTVTKIPTPAAPAARAEKEEVASPPVEIAQNDASEKEFIGGMLASATALPRLTDPVRVSQGVSQGMLRQRVVPPYPPQARQARIQGEVVLQAVITENGSIGELKVVKGHPLLIRPAYDAVKQWKYRPYLLNGKPVAIQTIITVNFRLP